MAEKFNFFEMDEADYKQGPLYPVLRRFDLILNHYVRCLAESSFQKWIDYLLSFRLPCDNIIWKTDHKPLIVLHLNLEAPKKSKKGKKTVVTQSEPIDFKPNLEKARKVITNCVDWIVESNNKIMNMETDLVPFLNIPKLPVYEIKSNNEAYISAAERVNHILDYYEEKP